MGNGLDMGDKEMGGIMNDIHLNKEVDGCVIYQNAMTWGVEYLGACV